MILEKLKLKNFRQFRGVQSLQFACDKKNVTVIFGENGRGKTGIFRAIMFCLYGDRQLSQDGDTPKDELQLINTAELDANAGGLGAPVEASVELEFKDGGRRFCLFRSVRGMLYDGKVLEELGSVRLVRLDEHGNSEILTDPKVITDIVRSILDPRVREYFLFDGEKMERLTKSTLKQKREISKGVRNLLDIDALEVAMGAVRKLRARLDSELAGKATGEYARVLNTLTESERTLGNKQEAITRHEDEIAKAKDESHDIDKKLEGFKEIESLLQQRISLESRETDIEDDLRTLRMEIRDRTGKTALLLSYPLMISVFNLIDGKVKKGQIPAEIRRDLIERILSDKKCICGSTIKAGTDEFECIQEWLLKSDDQELQDSVLNLWGHLRGMKDRQPDLAREAEGLLQKHSQLKQELESVRSELDSIGDSIGSDVRADAIDLEEQRRKIKSDLIRMEALRQRHVEESVDLTNSIKKLTAQKKALEQEEGLRNELVERSELATDVHQALRQVHKGFTNDAKISLAKDATEILKTLLDAESQSIFSKVVVSDDYSLQILDRWGNPFLANISAGQRQMMSISFIAALARAASGGKLLEMPLFMDTPFARLSMDHRKNLINNVPDLCAQWILLATDTELRRHEGFLFEKGGRLGHFYYLASGDNGETTIQPRTVSDALCLLRESEENAI